MLSRKKSQLHLLTVLHATHWYPRKLPAQVAKETQRSDAHVVVTVEAQGPGGCPGISGATAAVGQVPSQEAS